MSTDTNTSLRRHEIAILFLTIVICALGIGALLGGVQESYYWRTEAVKRGHAVWVVRVDGTTEFKWKEDAK